MSDRPSDPANVIERLYSAAPSVAGPEDAGLALAARECGLENRYRVWLGRSGKRYLVTVMPLSDAMRSEHGVVLIVAIEKSGRRKIVWAGECGAAIPGIELAPGVRLEAHVHLLAGTTSARRAEALADLVSGTQSYSSVLTVNADASQASVSSSTPRRSSSRAVLRT